MSDAATILVADDEQSAIDLVRQALADTPHRVIAAMDGERALEMAREHEPQLAILDVQMPKRNGFDVFVEMRSDEKLRSVPVIMLTAVTRRTRLKFSEKDVGEFAGSEPEAYIDKPVEPVILRQAVNRLLKQADADA